MRVIKQVLNVVLIVSIVLGLLSGCGKKEQNDVVGAEEAIAEVEMATEESSVDETVAEEDAIEELPDKEEADIEEVVEENDSEKVSSSKGNVSSFVENESGLSLNEIQLNSIAMLNYLTVLSQEIANSTEGRLFYEEAYSRLINNTLPSIVDWRTEAEIDDLLDTIESFRMLDVKRERLQFIYEHNKAQAIRSAIPNPMSILNGMTANDPLKSIVAILYGAVDAYTSYAAYNEQIDMEFLQQGWELDDEEAKELSVLRRDAFAYMIDIVRDYDLPGDLALNENSVADFVEWENVSNVVSRISFFESNKEVYKAFGPYWLVLGKSYYENEEYEKCLQAFEEYEKIDSRILRKNYQYAEVLPFAILSAKEVYKTDSGKYIDLIGDYCQRIIDNSDYDDWSTKYFVALTYIDLYEKSQDKQYLEKAYQLAFDNIISLVREQKNLNANWLNDVVERSIDEDASKEEKEEVKKYNKMLHEERKIALPPISEPLVLNCSLLFGLAEEISITEEEKTKVEGVLHENGEAIFLNSVLNSAFSFNTTNGYPTLEEAEVSFDGKTLSLPACFLSDDSTISLTVRGDETICCGDWIIKEVDREKRENDSEYIATYTSNTVKDIEFEDGMVITFHILPVEGLDMFGFDVTFIVEKAGWLVDWNPIKVTNFERI